MLPEDPEIGKAALEAIRRIVTATGELEGPKAER